MAVPSEKHYYIASEELREKYLGHFDQVQSLTKAIEASSRTKITVELKKNKTILFVITGGRKGVDKALRGVEYEFDKRQIKPKAQPRNQPKNQPRNQPRPQLKHRADVLFLEEDDHRTLHGEGNLCLLTENSLRKHDILTGATELRQFACGECNRPWWKYVPRTKPVSTCHTCHVRYDALDREKEFGIGRFICLPCDNTFYARCDATEMHLCFKCQMLKGPPYINPRFKPVFNSDKLYRTNTYKDPIFRREIMHASTPHDSTGSTVSSFLTVDLGPDIPVLVERGYGISARDYPSLSPSSSPIMPFEDGQAIPGDVSELEPRQDAEGGGHGSESEMSDLDAESRANSGNVSRKRTTGSDSSSSDSEAEEGSEVDKMSIQGSDSGVIVGNHLEEGNIVNSGNVSRQQTTGSDSSSVESTGSNVVSETASCDSSTGATVVVNHLDGDTKDEWPDLHNLES